ncbi:mitochondrial glycerol-3-phosphate dehydrogenase [Mucor circinelloides]
MHDWSGTILLGGSTTTTGFVCLHYQTNNVFKTRKSIVYAEQAAIEKPTWHAPTQKQELNKLNSNKEFDLLIVGGGATGTGVALEAASRELNVALVERDDFTSDMSLCTTVDVLARRTRLTFLNTEAALSAPPKVIELMFEELGWDKQRQSKSVSATQFLTIMGLFNQKTSTKE